MRSRSATLGEERPLICARALRERRESSISAEISNWSISSVMAVTLGEWMKMP
ncbi:hypothetical protein D3C80_2206990 [compost metagenome]